MKIQTLSLIAGAVLLLCLGRSPAAAQGTTKIQVPFSFQVGDQQLPAGDYVIKRDLTKSHLLWIESADRKFAGGALTIPLQLPNYPAETSLVFQCYGGQHFLTEVRFAGYGNGFAMFKSKAQRRAAQLAEVK